MNQAYPDSVLATTHLSLRYDERSVLDDITLAIPRGAVVGLVGRNGAGKSTLLRCLMGISVPWQGSAQVLDCPSLALSDAVRERLGYVGQTPDLLDWLSVWEHVRYIGGFYPRWNEIHARDLLIRFGLPEGLRVNSLSVGEQQKLAIVLALAHDPDVLIMDEPVASLDPLMRRDFMRSLFEGRGERQERSVLLSSHLLSDLERVVSHVIFLRDGRVQWFGERDAAAECLRVVQATQRLPAQAGLLAQRQVDGAWRAVIDTRHAASEVTGALAPDSVAMNLDDLFVELNA